MNDINSNNGSLSEAMPDQNGKNGTTPPKKVAFLGTKGLPFSGGVESVIEGMVRHLDPEQYHAVVYCDSRIVPKDYEVPNVTFVYVPSLPGKHLRAASHSFSAAMHALFRDRYDLIHLHNAESSFVLPLLKLRYSRIIATSHGQAQARDKWGRMAKFLMGLMEYPFTRFADVATSVSQPLASYYEQRYGRTVQYIPNGIDDLQPLSQEAVDRALDKHGLEPGYIMFAAGRVIPSKGGQTLLRAFSQIDIPDARLIIVGDTQQVPAYEKKLKDLADDRVTFIPFISDNTELRSLIQAARYFVFPSTIEAMSMMLLQVVSYGTPVIYSDIPENLAVISDAEICFKTGDAADLREKMQFAWNNPETMRRLAQVNQERITTEHGWHRIVRQYEELYSSAV